MPRITALESQQRMAERINVFLDGEFAFGLAAITAQQAGLHIGRTLSQAEIDDLLVEDNFQKAFNRALILLGYRPRSEDEVRRRLLKAKVEPPIVDKVVERLREDGLLDDMAFAKYWAENRGAFNP
ncbi:MAG: regulatory protein RecX, partial [Chloroflexota bacterium]